MALAKGLALKSKQVPCGSEPGHSFQYQRCVKALPVSITLAGPQGSPTQEDEYQPAEFIGHWDDMFAQLLKGDLLTFWFSLVGPLLVKTPKKLTFCF